MMSLPHLRHPPYAPASLFVWGMAISQMVGWGALYWPFSLMIGPMEAELGWTRSELTGALSAGLLVSGLATFVFGYWIDGRQSRVLVAACAVLGAAMLVLWSSATSLWVFYLVWIFMGIALAGTVQDIIFAAILANVSSYRRSLIYITLAIGFSSTVFLPLTTFLIQNIGWRHSLLVLALVQFFLAAVPNWVLLRNVRPSDPAPDASREPVAGLQESDDNKTLPKAVSTLAFWALTLCVSTHTFLYSATVFHVIPLFGERGLTAEEVVIGWALLGPAQILGRVVLLFFGERTPSTTAGRFVVWLFPLSYLQLALAGEHMVGVIIFTTLFGIANGTMTIVRLTSITEVLGTHRYGAIIGTMNFVTTWPRTMGPVVAAYLWQVHGSYDVVIWLLVLLGSIGAMSFWVGTRKTRRSAE